ncbi:hypothetical protein B566_EDAN013761 [Ephemera danica]|nr:hypothetical protein B566_EDAN013761 [Ephemera danica]
MFIGEVMSIYRRGGEKVVFINQEDESVVNIVGGSIRGWSMMFVPEMEEYVVECSGSIDIDSPAPLSPRSPGMEQEKRIRREIANSNERRRMQSINAGFQSLRTLLPHHEGEKLSKVGC